MYSKSGSSDISEHELRQTYPEWNGSLAELPTGITLSSKVVPGFCGSITGCSASGCIASERGFIKDCPIPANVGDSASCSLTGPQELGTRKRSDDGIELYSSSAAIGVASKLTASDDTPSFGMLSPGNDDKLAFSPLSCDSTDEILPGFCSLAKISGCNDELGCVKVSIDAMDKSSYPSRGHPGFYLVGDNLSITLTSEGKFAICATDSKSGEQLGCITPGSSPEAPYKLCDANVTGCLAIDCEKASIIPGFCDTKPAPSEPSSDSSSDTVSSASGDSKMSGKKVAGIAVYAVLGSALLGALIGGTVFKIKQSRARTKVAKEKIIEGIKGVAKIKDVKEEDDNTKTKREAFEEFHNGEFSTKNNFKLEELTEKSEFKIKKKFGGRYEVSVTKGGGKDTSFTVKGEKVKGVKGALLEATEGHAIKGMIGGLIGGAAVGLLGAFIAVLVDEDGRSLAASPNACFGNFARSISGISKKLDTLVDTNRSKSTDLLPAIE